MMKFLKFKSLMESEGSDDRLLHLPHLEEHMITHGEAGLHHALDALNQTNEFLNTGHSESQITTKYDGSPSVIFGHHPTTGRFFVATKSGFNKTPKINYTPQDVDANHGHAPGLALKLKQALRHLPKVAPEKGTYQGDLMYGEGDVNTVDGKHHFTPNTITYSADVNSPEAEKIEKSKIGIVVHTKYNKSIFTPETGTGMSFHPDTHNFKPHKDVNLIDHRVDNTSLAHPEINQNKYQRNIDAAKKLYKTANKNMFSTIQGHADHIKTYVNDTVRNSTAPETNGLKNHLREKYARLVEKLKTPSKKLEKQRELDAHVQHIENNQHHYDTFFKIHNHIQKAKNALVNSLSQSHNKFDHSIGETKTAPEGFVIHHRGIPLKLVDRAEFSKQNFLKSKNR